MSGTPHANPIRVFLLDDHEIVRRGVAAILEAEDDLCVVGQAATAASAVHAIARGDVDVAVLDISLADGSGIDVCRALRQVAPSTRSVMLTSVVDERALIAAKDAGAAAFVVKSVDISELLHTIRRVGAGQSLLDAVDVRLAERSMGARGEAAVLGLTPQERAIFELLGRGYTNRQIAEEMLLAEKTVKNYVSNVLSRLGMARRAEAAALAARLDERARVWV
jgi:DNA-binding NarL/FixJ family response regulator